MEEVVDLKLEHASTCYQARKGGPLEQGSLGPIIFLQLAGEQVHSPRAEEYNLRMGPKEVVGIAINFYREIFQADLLSSCVITCKEQVCENKRSTKAK